MSTNGAIETFEVERKYQVSGDASLPSAEAFAGVGLQLAAPETHQLCASYFDTPQGMLAGKRIAVRMRTGGSDAGWHMKARNELGARELQWPHDAEMPSGLRAEIEALIGADTNEIVTIATLRTTRVTRMLIDANGSAVIELADDQVDATNELAAHRQEWREWEAELMPDADATLLDTIEPLLVAAGAERVQGTSKIQRTMLGGNAGASAGREMREGTKQ